MAKLSETVLQLVDDVDAAEEKVKQVSKDHVAAVKELGSAQRLEKKAREATLEAHKVHTELLRDLVEVLTKELEEAPVNEEPASDTSGNTVVPKSAVEAPES